MTDDRRPLRTLFDQVDSEETYHTEESSLDVSRQTTALQVIEEADRLNAPLGELLLTIFRRGPASLEQLAETQDLSPETTERHLTELKLQGYVTPVRNDGKTLYRVADSWETEDFPSGPVIPLVYQYNLLSDQSRLEALERALEEAIETDDVVADLGAGAGVLSHLSAERAEQVYAVEIDRDVYQKGLEVMRSNNIDNVEYILADARVVDLPETVDVVVCEMLDTALAAELQIPVMNHANRELLAEDGITVPYEAKTTVTAVESDYDFVGATFSLPHFEAYGARESISRSSPVTLNRVCFEEINNPSVRETVTIEITDAGTINGIQLNTDIRFAEGLEFTSGSEWLCPPLTLPLDAPLSVVEGERLNVTLDYRMGGGLNDIECTVTRPEGSKPE